MCLIAYRPVVPGKARHAIPPSVVDTAFGRHPDGFGIVYRENGCLRVEKFAPNERKPFRKALIRADKAGVEYAAHWRFATHGPKDRAHAHPYTYEDPIEGTVAVLHNGIINIHAAFTESDTEVFVRDVLARLPSGWWRVPAQRYLVSQAIGYSKLVVMTGAESVVINEDDGEWDGGLWYSSNHKPAPKWQPTKGHAVPSWTPATGKSASDAYKVLTGTTAPVAEPTKPVLIPAVTGEDAYLPDEGAVHVPSVLRHGGHDLETLKPVNWSKGDAAYRRSVRCTVCGTFGDVYVIEGNRFIELKHPGASRVGATVGKAAN